MTQRIGKSGNSKDDTKNEHVIDFKQVRDQRLEEKRRNTERIFFKNLLNVYSITGHSQMRPIELIDVSENGISFQVPYEADNPWPTRSENLPIRLYFSQNTYLEVIIHVQNSRDSIENKKRYIRFGCSVDTEVQSYPAYQQFVKFLKLYSEHARKDMGDVTVFYI